MRTFIFLALLVFVALPVDAQYALLGLARVVWLSPTGQMMLAGAFGASLAAMLWFSWGWNSLADQIYRDDIRKAEQSLAQRRRG